MDVRRPHLFVSSSPTMLRLECMNGLASIHVQYLLPGEGSRRYQDLTSGARFEDARWADVENRGFRGLVLMMATSQKECKGIENEGIKETDALALDLVRTKVSRYHVVGFGHQLNDGSFTPQKVVEKHSKGLLDTGKAKTERVDSTSIAR